MRHATAVLNQEAAWYRSQGGMMTLVKLIDKLNADWPLIHSGIYQFTATLFENIERGGKLIMYGNGGSAADCDHIVGEFRGRFLLNRPSVEAISLSDSIATVTAIGNDFGYDKVFSRQLDGIAKEYDSIIALTTSGTSKNIVGSLFDVNRRFPEINSLVITGQAPEFIEEFKYHIRIPIEYEKKNVARIQEMTMFILHTMCMIFDFLYESHEQGY